MGKHAQLDDYLAASGGDRESRRRTRRRCRRRARRAMRFCRSARGSRACGRCRSGRPTSSTGTTSRTRDAHERRPFVHESAYVDDGATIGAGTKIWHFCHVMPGAVIGERCSLGQNVVVMNGTRIGNEVQDPEQRVDLRGRRARGRRVLRSVDGVHERDESAQPRLAQERVSAHAREARRVDRRERDDRLRRRRSASMRSSAPARS